MDTNRTINVVQVKGLEGSLEEVLQLCGLKHCELSLRLDHSEHWNTEVHMSWLFFPPSLTFMGLFGQHLPWYVKMEKMVLWFRKQAETKCQDFKRSLYF